MISQADMAGFIVDSLLVVGTSLVLMRYWSAAGCVLLGNFIVLHIFVYFVLTQLSFWQIFYIDYHLYLLMFGLLVCLAIGFVSSGHALVKLFLGAEMLLHGMMIVFGVMYSKGKVSQGAFTVIYDSYPYARILLASFQITGLVTHVDRNNRGGRNVDTSWGSSIRHNFDNWFWRATSLPRVKRS